MSGKQDVIPEIRKQFRIEPTTNLRILLHDEEFEEYVDVEIMEHLPSRGKLLIVTSDSER